MFSSWGSCEIQMSSKSFGWYILSLSYYTKDDGNKENQVPGRQSLIFLQCIQFLPFVYLTFSNRAAKWIGIAMCWISFRSSARGRHTEQTASLTCALGLVSPRLDIRWGRLLFGVTDERRCKWAVLVCFLVHLSTVCMTFSYRNPSDGPSIHRSGEVLFCALPAGLWVLFPKPWTLASFYRLSSCTWLTWVTSQK